MSATKIIVRRAVQMDAELIARAVAMAIGDEKALKEYCGDDYLAVLAEIAHREATQYSWQYALVAEVVGVAAGAIIGYDGAQLGVLREGTFAVLREYIGRIPVIADETECGEYYIDSLGVMPEFRGLGIGSVLINALCDKASNEGHERVGLIVDFDNHKAEDLYFSLGFTRVGTRIFFGHKMWHLQRKQR